MKCRSTVHSALDIVMNVPNYSLEHACVLCNENLTEAGSIGRAIQAGCQRLVGIGFCNY